MSFTKLKWTLLSGIEVVIESEYEWFVFCDIFVNRDYPFVVGEVTETPVRILDLGANQGYFSLFVADACRRMNQPFTIHAVEALSKTYNTLRKRTQQVPAIVTWHGAAGKRSGTAHISQSLNSATSSLMEEKHNEGKTYPSEPVDYLNLDKLGGPFDIIKCDIEGSEYDLLKTYPDLIKQAKVVFMELHYADGDAEKFRKDMAELGFSRQLLVDRVTAAVEILPMICKKWFQRHIWTDWTDLLDPDGLWLLLQFRRCMRCQKKQTRSAL